MGGWFVRHWTFGLTAFHSGPVPSAVTRIFSDVHFGDRASRVHRLAQLRPLLEGASALVLNGDSLDTRAGPVPADTAALRAEVLDFFAREAPAATLLTGNHDPDISSHHLSDLAAGRVLVVHGDILFDDIVPWSADASRLGALIATELAAMTPQLREQLPDRLAAWRRAAGSIPQRHQSERGLRYLRRFAADMMWPPTRILRVLFAWREEPARAAKLLQRYRPAAKIIITGHTHRPGYWTLPDGRILINTGSFCPPFGGWLVDVGATHAVIRRIANRGGEFRPGAVVAEIPLAAA